MNKKRRPKHPQVHLDYDQTRWPGRVGNDVLAARELRRQLLETLARVILLLRRLDELGQRPTSPSGRLSS